MSLDLRMIVRLVLLAEFAANGERWTLLGGVGTGEVVQNRTRSKNAAWVWDRSVEFHIFARIGVLNFSEVNLR